MESYIAQLHYLASKDSFEDKEAYEAHKEITVFRCLAEYGDYLGEH